jgi:hypothetical protein
MEYVLTRAGAKLLAGLSINGSSLHLTQAKVGTDYSSNPEYLTDVEEEQADIQIADAGMNGETAEITVMVTNSGLDTEFKIRQLGIFAMDDETETELLFLVGQDIYGDRMPPFSSGRVEYKYVIYLKVSNTSGVVVDVNDSDFVLKKTFYRTTAMLFPQVTDEKMKIYIKTPAVEKLVIGQMVIADKKVYTYVGDDCHNIKSYCQCGGGHGDYFNIAVPFYLTFEQLAGDASDYNEVEFADDYDNAYNVASACYSLFKTIPESLKDYSSSVIGNMMNREDIEPAFNYVFNRKIIESFTPLSSVEIQKAINTQWTGETSDNSFALTPEEIQRAINTQWTGETSANPFAITSSQILNIVNKE